MTEEEYVLEYHDCDLFIAYYLQGKPGTGSENAAAKVYEALKGEKKGNGEPYKIFFLPKSTDNINSNFTKQICKNSKALLFVVDNEVPRFDNNGRYNDQTGDAGSICKRTENGALKRVIDEFAMFDNSEIARQIMAKGIDTAKILVTNDYTNSNDNNYNANDALLLYPTLFNRTENPTVFNKTEDANGYSGIKNWLRSIVDAIPSRTPTHLYWIGPRESDIASCGELFDGSVTIFGNDDKIKNYAMCSSGVSTRVDHNNSDDRQYRFVADAIRRVIDKDPSAKFYSYNPAFIYDIFTKSEGRYGSIDIDKHFICMNDEKLMDKLSDKRRFRNEILKNLPGVEVLSTIDDVHNDNVDYHALCSRMRDVCEINANCRFILQAPVSSGGNGTFVLNQTNADLIMAKLSQDGSAAFLCSEYREKNVSVNIHAVIFEDSILLSPMSIQLMRESDSRLMYRGADFIECTNIPLELRTRFKEQAQQVAEQIQKEGYRGVCGIDGIITPTEVLILEVNNRFQASTGLLNMALVDNGLPTVQELNLLAFTANNDLIASVRAAVGLIDESKIKDAKQKLQNLVVPYANYAYHKNITANQAKHVYDIFSQTSGTDRERFMANNNIACFNFDGFNGDIRTGDANAYLYSIVLKTNIVWISEENTLFFSENIADEPKRIKNFIEYPDSHTTEEVMIALKIALNTQGVVPVANCELREGTFKAVDLKFKNEKYQDFVVNAPIPNAVNCDEENAGESIRFIDMTPFRLMKDEDGNLALYYFGKKVDNVDVYPPDVVATTNRIVNNNECTIPYNCVAYLSSDRLRVHVTNQCKFKKTGNSCKFCDIKMRSPEFIPDSAIEEVVKAYLDEYKPEGRAVTVNGHEALRHYLIGGQSADVDDDAAADRLVSVVRTIHGLDVNADIYAMILPCNTKLIDRLIGAGLKEIAFNIEIFDDELAKKYMPGKGNIPREKYLSALEDASVHFEMKGVGSRNVVRSMLLIGLEPFENTVNGVEALVKLNVQPMLSVFRPLPGTPLSNLVSPPMESVFEIYKKAQEICRKNGQILGPKCDNCKNNTISLPLSALPTLEN